MADHIKRSGYLGMGVSVEVYRNGHVRLDVKGGAVMLADDQRRTLHELLSDEGLDLLPPVPITRRTIDNAPTVRWPDAAAFNVTTSLQPDGREGGGVVLCRKHAFRAWRNPRWRIYAIAPTELHPDDAGLCWACKIDAGGPGY